ncbi:hypothetical protein [Marinobacter sp.]|uniref:hypothetical protein n=1 Tax=Marinobacter sp. TaxID=50741 RepID=UPI00384D19F5
MTSLPTPDWHFEGTLSRPLGRQVATEARNMVFPLHSESDFIWEAGFTNSTHPVYTLPSTHYGFLDALLKEIDRSDLPVDLILMRLGSPTTLPLPARLLGPDVFLCLDPQPLLINALAQEKKVLSVVDRFCIRYVDEQGDNSISLSYWSPTGEPQGFHEPESFLAQQGIIKKTAHQRGEAR